MGGKKLTTVKIKPLSVNDAWKGRRFKSDEYKAYSQELLLKLPPKIELPEGKKQIFFEFGISNMGGDYDNSIKATQDLISAKYEFNDSQIQEGHIRKIKTKKGEEYVAFSIIAERTAQQSFDDWCDSIGGTHKRKN